MEFDRKIMSVALREATNGVMKGHGGPFGAVIVSEGKIISSAHNEVVRKNDPTAHAEILAIRKAAKKLKNFNLEGCVLYSTCEPCPMCLSAILWARIKKLIYVCSRHDAQNIGFDDSKFYYYLYNQNEFNAIITDQKDYEECYQLFEFYKSLKNKILY